ncbi:MAG: STAS/SEC14 domain-containing protein [Chthoniobacter sp.]|nr:STAS/SEC14 domain-containing protein [Chthoniobacter sp.]
MAAKIQRESKNFYVLHLSGVVKHLEFSSERSILEREIDAGAQPRILAILENFEGWERGVGWNDLDFQLSHGGEIQRIAIVAEPRWEPQALAFAGAGFRNAPVRFFPSGQDAQARAWLAG